MSLLFVARLLGTSLLLASLFGQSPALAEEQPVFIVTCTPLKLILGELTQSRAEVRLLLPAGANAHSYDPKPGDAKAAAQSTAFFWVHENFDGWAARLSAPRKVEVFALLPHTYRRQFSASDHDHEHDHEHEGHSHDEGSHGSPDDPHFWTDPLSVAALLAPLAAELSRIDPAGSAQYKSNAAAFALRLDRLHSEISELTLPLHGRPMLQMHNSFAYFIARYGLRDAGVVEPFPGKEPSPRYIAELLERVRSQSIRAIFSETLLPKKPAEVLAQSAGLPLYTLDPSCGASETGYSDYEQWLRSNAEIIVEALR
jgi:ABC-type Zn uptake system ZnuABC Zn-binding protein ZnuA